MSTIQDNLNEDEEILEHGDRARLYRFEEGEFGRTKYAIVTPYVSDEGDEGGDGDRWKRREYSDERRARIAYQVEDQREHGHAVPLEYINHGKNAVAAYLYLEALESVGGHRRRKKSMAYERVAEQMGVSKQAAKNYVSRYLNED